MAQRTRTVLKNWFVTGAIPTQSQFWDLIDSFLSVMEDTLPVSKVQGLETLLNGKAEKQAFTAHVDDTGNPHQVSKNQVGLGNIPNAVSDAIDEDSSVQLATSKAVYRLKQMIDAISQVTEHDFTGDAQHVVSMGTLLEGIVIIPSTNIMLSIGTSEGGTELQPPLEYPGGQAVYVPVGLYANGTDLTVYFSGITAPTTVRFYNK